MFTSYEDSALSVCLFWEVFRIVLYRGIAASIKHHFAALNILLVHDQQSLPIIQEE